MASARLPAAPEEVNVRRKFLLKICDYLVVWLNSSEFAVNMVSADGVVARFPLVTDWDNEFSYNRTTLNKLRGECLRLKFKIFCSVSSPVLFLCCVRCHVWCPVSGVTYGVTSGVLSGVRCHTVVSHQQITVLSLNFSFPARDAFTQIGRGFVHHGRQVGFAALEIVDAF
jgi:hypothetical protein